MALWICFSKNNFIFDRHTTNPTVLTLTSVWFRFFTVMLYEQSLWSLVLRGVTWSILPAWRIIVIGSGTRECITSTRTETFCAELQIKNMAYQMWPFYHENTFCAESQTKNILQSTYRIAIVDKLLIVHQRALSSWITNSQIMANQKWPLSSREFIEKFSIDE